MPETKLTADQLNVVLPTMVNRFGETVIVAPATTLATHTLAAALNPVEADPIHNLAVYRNGVLQAQPGDYTYNTLTKVVTFQAASTPQAGDVVQFESIQ